MGRMGRMGRMSRILIIIIEQSWKNLIAGILTFWANVFFFTLNFHSLM